MKRKVSARCSSRRGTLTASEKICEHQEHYIKTVPSGVTVRIAKEENQETCGFGFVAG